MKQIDNKSAIPIYTQLADILREYIKNAKFRSHGRLPSENDLSRRHSVSRMSARAALLQLESEGLISCIPGKGRFVVEKQASSPSGHFSSFTIGVYPFKKLIGETDFYYGALLNGLAQGFLHHHVRSKFLAREEMETPSCSSFSFLSQKGVDGIIWIGPQEKQFPEIMELQENKLPVVAVNRTFPGSGIDYVACDHYKGSYKLVEYLIHMGHRKIACITVSEKLSHLTQRWQGYLDAHRQYGLLANPKLTIKVESSGKDVAEKLHPLRKKNDWPTAIFVAGAALIPDTLKYLSKERIKIPEHISVVAFDEIPPPPGSPRITCVRQPVEKIGEAAVDILIRNLGGRKTHPAETVMEPIFVLGDSCAPCSKISDGTKRKVSTRSNCKGKH